MMDKNKISSNCKCAMRVQVFPYLSIEKGPYSRGFSVVKYLFSQANVEIFLTRTCCIAVKIATNNFQTSFWHLHEVQRLIKKLLLAQERG